MADIAIVFGVFIFLSIIAFFIIKFSKKDFRDLQRNEMLLLAIVMPLSLYAPVFFLNSIGGYAFILYLLSIPLGVYTTGIIVDVKQFSYKQIANLYFQLLWKVVAGFMLLGVVVRIIKYALR